MYLKILLICFLAISLKANWKTERERLDNLYKLGDFRIFYTFKGEDALPVKNRKDQNNNNIPDYIENIAQRLHISKELFTKVLGFQDPLQSKRYKGVKYIDVHILKSSYSTSGDGIVTYNYKILNTKDKVLSMKIRNDLSKGTLTPSHEYFHTLQNSYTMFKNRWYTEGTARWSEKVFKRGTGTRGNLPQNIKQLKELLKQTYSTKTFWRKLAYLCDTNNGYFTNTLGLKTDVVGYPNLIEDTRIYGYNFIKSFLENLDSEDNIASKDRGFKEFQWKEKEQKENKENNKYILRALNKTIISHCPKGNKEIIRFLEISNQFINKGEYRW